MFEIERKFLIEKPDEDFLMEFPGAVCDSIVQVYLESPKGETSRVRCRRNGEKCTYTKTTKKKLSGITRIELEDEISKEDYEALLLKADKSLRPIEKKRYTLPFEGHMIEIDIFPFWDKAAFAEVELEREDEEFSLPEFIKVLRDVSEDKRFSNAALAREIPDLD